MPIDVHWLPADEARTVFGRCEKHHNYHNSMIDVFFQHIAIFIGVFTLLIPVITFVISHHPMQPPATHAATLRFIRTSTWWLIPLSKWLITPVLNGISRVNPLVIGVN